MSKKEISPTSIRFSALAASILDKLKPMLGLNTSGVIEVALRDLAVKYGVLPPPGATIKGGTIDKRQVTTTTDARK